MIRTILLAAAAAVTLATGTIASPSDADAGFNITIGNYGYGYGSVGYHGGSRRYVHGYRRGGYYGGWGWYGSRSAYGYGRNRSHCRWRVKRVNVRYWDAYNYRWTRKIVHRRYRVCR